MGIGTRGRARREKFSEGGGAVCENARVGPSDVPTIASAQKMPKLCKGSILGCGCIRIEECNDKFHIRGGRVVRGQEKLRLIDSFWKRYTQHVPRGEKRRLRTLHCQVRSRRGIHGLLRCRDGEYNVKEPRGIEHRDDTGYDPCIRKCSRNIWKRNVPGTNGWLSQNWHKQEWKKQNREVEESHGAAFVCPSGVKLIDFIPHLEQYGHGRTRVKVERIVSALQRAQAH